MGPVADLGAGNGWLSYKLAECGYRVMAVDSSLEEPFGLGAADVYLTQEDFLVVQGDLNRPPLQAGRFSLVLFNASLHYAKDIYAALRRTARALLPEGKVAILDSPVAREPRPGSSMGDRHLGRQELHDALASAGLRPRWLILRRGLRWWVMQASRMARGKSPISLPLIVAHRA
jgi:SAM-dependent methyltransferase